MYFNVSGHSCVAGCPSSPAKMAGKIVEETFLFGTFLFFRRFFLTVAAVVHCDCLNHARGLITLSQIRSSTLIFA